jgi:hypothetical protein
MPPLELSKRRIRLATLPLEVAGRCVVAATLPYEVEWHCILVAMLPPVLATRVANPAWRTVAKFATIWRGAPC